MTYLRENGLKLALLLLLLVLLSPTALAQPYIQAVEQAQSALAFGRIDQSLRNLEQARHFEPAAYALHKNEFQLSFQLGLLDDAEHHLQALAGLGLRPESVRCSNLQLALAQNKYSPSIAVEPASLSSCPEAEIALRQLASDYFEAGQFEQALPILENLLASGDENEAERTMLAYFTAANDPTNATDLLRQTQSSQGPGSELAVSLLMAIQDNLELETPAYLSARIGQLFSREAEWYLAQIAFERAIAEDPEYAQAWGYLGVAKESSGRDGGADLTQALRLAPDDPVLLVMQATHYNQNGQGSLALPLLEKAAGIDPENPAIASALGQTYTLTGDLEGAKAAYRQATLLAPDEAPFWNLLADFSLQHEIDIDRLALPALRNALILDPGAIKGWRSLGYAHYLQGNFPLAKRALTRALTLSPTDPATQYFLGLLFHAEGFTEEAIAAWKAAIRISPEHAYAKLAGRALENLGIVP